MRRVTLLLLILSSVGCVDTLQDAAHPPGQIDQTGRIYPCHGLEGDKQLCGDSKFFAKAVVKVTIGQTKKEVREIMRRDPWRREASSEQDVILERWGYPTSYEDERMVWITFSNGLVTKLDETAWETEKD